MKRNGIVHLDSSSIEIFSGFGAFVHFDFYPWGFCLMRLLTTGDFLCPPRDCWSIKIFSGLGLLSALILILGAFSTEAFLCPPK